jgi:hypothetical protein
MISGEILRHFSGAEKMEGMTHKNESVGDWLVSNLHVQGSRSDC